MSEGEKTEEEKNFIRALDEDLRYSVSKFDGQTLAMSGGALGISLTFIKDIVPFQYSVYSWLLYSAQFLFTVAITIGFVSHYRSMRGTIRSIEKADARKFGEILLSNKKDNAWIHGFNSLIVWVLPIGILLLVLYSLTNIENSRRHTFTEVNDQRILIEKAFENGSTVTIDGGMTTLQFSDTTGKKTIIKIK